MPAELRIVDPPEVSPRWWAVTEGEPGDMFRWPPFDKAGREAWCIVLPNEAGLWWTTYEADDGSGMWDVTGEPPRITVAPSIDSVGNGPGHWHGYITDGIMVP